MFNYYEFGSAIENEHFKIFSLGIKFNLAIK